MRSLHEATRAARDSKSGLRYGTKSWRPKSGTECDVTDKPKVFCKNFMRHLESLRQMLYDVIRCSWSTRWRQLKQHDQTPKRSATGTSNQCVVERERPRNEKSVHPNLPKLCMLCTHRAKVFQSLWVQALFWSHSGHQIQSAWAQWL